MKSDDNSNDNEDVKIILSSPASSTSTQQLLDASGNKIGELELNTFENFTYANESFSTIIDRVVWGEHDTNYLLEKYELYISEVGPRKRFHSKKYMWNQIANDIYLKFKLVITGAQCENRYKTICKRKKQLADNSKSINSKTVEEERNATSTTATEESPENDLSNGIQVHFERLEQSNQELTQQIEQFGLRILTMVERSEKQHSRQHQRFEKSIQENKDQLRSNFTTMFEKLDKIHDTIQQNQEHQQKLLEKLIKDRREDHKADFATLLNVLDKIYQTMKCDGPSRQSRQEESNHSMVTEKQESTRRMQSNHENVVIRTGVPTLKHYFPESKADGNIESYSKCSPALVSAKNMGLFSGKCMSTARLDGKTIIITGSNTGIGKTTAMDLFKRGAYVIMACRDTCKARETATEISNLCSNHQNVGKLEVMELNLCSFKSIRESSDQLLRNQKRIDMLINNAGVMCCPYGKTEDGFEIQFGSNYLGHFLLTILLLPRLIESKPARIINVSSIAHKMGVIDFNDINWEKKPYKPLEAYQQSKLCNVLFTKELDRRLRELNIEGVNVYSVHPGVIRTELGRHLTTHFLGLRWILSFARLFFKTPEQGAQTTIYCAVDENAGKESGLYYSECKPATPSKNAENMEDARKLWEASLKMVNLRNYNPFAV